MSNTVLQPTAAASAADRFANRESPGLGAPFPSPTAGPFQATDYIALSQDLHHLVNAAAGEGYTACVARLLESMRQRFPALTREHNPVMTNLQKWDESGLRFLIQEYSAFSNAAIHLFLEARIRNHWPALRDEIIRNMDEEMGVLTRGIPHLELMRYGYRVELGIETDGVHATAITLDFIERMNSVFRTRDNAFLAGVLLAFEGTAVDEFRVVESLLRRFQHMRGGDIPSDSLTAEYVAGHVAPDTVDPQNDPELDHYRGLVDAVGGHVEQTQLESMATGFLSVCLELNRWWEQLAVETIQRDIRHRLARHRPEPPEIYRTLRRGA